MNNECEQIKAQLTEPQIQTLVAAVQNRPYNTSEHDLVTFLQLGLFERPLIDPGNESYSGNRESRAGYGHPVPSEIGREWVQWYLAAGS